MAWGLVVAAADLVTILCVCVCLVARKQKKKDKLKNRKIYDSKLTPEGIDLALWILL